METFLNSVAKISNPALGVPSEVERAKTVDIDTQNLKLFCTYQCLDARFTHVQITMNHY